MSECMWADGLFQPNGISQFFNDMKNHDSGNVFPPFADEDKIFISLFDEGMIPVDEIELQFFDGSGRNGHQSLFAPFAFHLDESFLQVEVGQFEVAEFRNS